MKDIEVKFDHHEIMVLVSEILANRVYQAMSPGEMNDVKRQAKKLAAEKVAEVMVNNLRLA